MNVLVTAAGRQRATYGIAEAIGGTLRANGIEGEWREWPAIDDWSADIAAALHERGDEATAEARERGTVC